MFDCLIMFHILCFLQLAKSDREVKRMPAITRMMRMMILTMMIVIMRIMTLKHMEMDYVKVLC